MMQGVDIELLLLPTDLRSYGRLPESGAGGAMIVQQ